LTGPGDGTPENEPNRPQGFQNNPSLWESITVSRFGGANSAERDALAQSTYTGFVDRNVDSATRMRAREDALAGFSFFGVQFDWNAWRREMGY
jgi:hypothetical protein